MAEVGLLPLDARTELLDGEIIDMAPIGSRHAWCVARLTMVLGQRLADEALLWVRSPVRLNDLSEPQPDLALLRLPDDIYEERLPSGSDILLLVEVADTSVRFDRLRKTPAYARAGVVEVWLIDLEARTIECHRDPVDGAYRQVAHFVPGDTISAAFAPDATFEVTDFIR